MNAVSDHIAHHQGDAGSGQWDDVVPVAADAGLGLCGRGATSDLHGRLLCGVLREQNALQGEGSRTRVRVAAGFVNGRRRPGGDLLREEQVLVVEGIGVAVPDELREAQGGVSGPQWHHRRRVGPVVASVTGRWRAGLPGGLSARAVHRRLALSTPVSLADERRAMERGKVGAAKQVAGCFRTAAGLTGAGRPRSGREHPDRGPRRPGRPRRPDRGHPLTMAGNTVA